MFQNILAQFEVKFQKINEKNFLIIFLEKEDMKNSVIAGGATGFMLAARQGVAVASVSGAIGALLLGLIEGGSMLMNRFGTEMLKPMAPMDQGGDSAPQAFDSEE